MSFTKQGSIRLFTQNPKQWHLSGLKRPKKNAQRGPRRPQNGSKTNSKRCQNDPKVTSKWPQIDPKMVQNHPKSPKMVHVSHKIAPKWPYVSPDRVKMAQERLKKEKHPKAIWNFIKVLEIHSECFKAHTLAAPFLGLKRRFWPLFFKQNKWFICENSREVFNSRSSNFESPKRAKKGPKGAKEAKWSQCDAKKSPKRPDIAKNIYIFFSIFSILGTPYPHPKKWK